MARVRSGAPLSVGLAAIACLAIWWTSAGVELGFYTILNDFWGLFFLAEHLSLADPGTLHNGFFPIGYPLLLRALIGESILRVAFGVSVVAAVGTLIVAIRWLAGEVDAWVAVPVVLALGLHPLFFQHAVTAGPDMLALALSICGALALASALARGSTGLALVAGLVLGASGLMRYHGFLFATASVLAGALSWPERWRQVLGSAAMLALAGSAQVVANVFAGVGPLQTAQAFNVYKMFNPIDWFHLQRTYPDSVLDVIRLAPGRYVEAYLAQMAPTLPLLIPGVAAVALAGERTRRLSRYTLVASAVYLPLSQPVVKDAGLPQPVVAGRGKGGTVPISLRNRATGNGDCPPFPMTVSFTTGC